MGSIGKKQTTRKNRWIANIIREMETLRKNKNVMLEINNK